MVGKLKARPTDFKWLPFDIELRKGYPEIVSYINNLHPLRHLGLYKAIEKLAKAAIPL